MSESTTCNESSAPWAMQLVARVEKLDPPTAPEVAAAAVRAVIGLLTDERADPETGAWRHALESWQGEGRIRKLVRRARASAWQRAQEPDGHTARCGRAEVRAYVPCPMDEVPEPVAKLQIRSTALDGASDDDGTDNQAEGLESTGLVIAVTPEVEMSWGKQAAQCAHAGQLLWRQTSPGQRESWKLSGMPVSILHPDRSRFAQLTDEAEVTVRDGGFTEIPAGTLTAVAWWRR